MSVTTKKKERVKFSKAFWVANTVELLERAAYYGVFVVITLYLSGYSGCHDRGSFFRLFVFIADIFGGSCRQDRLPEINVVGVCPVVAGVFGAGVVPEFPVHDGVG